MKLPVWKCKACGCLWRDNLDNSVSLLNAEQQSCASCEFTPPRHSCEIYWLKLASPSSVPAQDEEIGRLKAEADKTAMAIDAALDKLASPSSVPAQEKQP